MRAGLVGIVAGTEQVILQMTAEGGDRQTRRYVLLLYFCCLCNLIVTLRAKLSGDSVL